MNLIAFFPCTVALKEYPKISGYLDRISKIWIMKKNDIQSIQVSMYPKKTDIHVSKYPCIQISMISKYPLIQVSKENQYPRYPSFRISKKSGIHSSLSVVYELNAWFWIQLLNSTYLTYLVWTYGNFHVKTHYHLKFLMTQTANYCWSGNLFCDIQMWKYVVEI